MDRAIVLIDGEHYLPVTKWAIDTAVKKEFDVLGAVFIGGTEKIGTKEDLEGLGIPVVIESDPLMGIRHGIELFGPEAVVDLSDDPVVRYEDRFRFANLILSRGVAYVGADFRFEAPVYLDVMRKPSISIVGTGKRTGKTAVCAYVARVLSGQENQGGSGLDPCIVTMGRGGPLEPELVSGKELDMTPEFMLSLADQGKHAASDHFEDALTTRLTTIGSRRCGGGLAGQVYASNVYRSAEIANQLPEDIVLFEGSGASLPPVRTDAEILIVGAHQPVDHIRKYMGPYRVMRADLVVLTMCEAPMADEAKVREMDACIQEINGQAKVVHTVFRPKPLEDIEGSRVLVTLTTPEPAVSLLKEWLNTQFGCEVIATSSHLASRPLLREDISIALERSPEIDTVLTEIKAAGIDVATRIAMEAGRRVVYMDNIMLSVGGDGELPSLIREVAQKAMDRYWEGKDSKSQ